MRTMQIVRSAMALGLWVAAHGVSHGQTPIDPNWSENGVASWYGPGFAGRPTASGEIYNPNHLTAAHKTLPLGTLVRVYNVENDREMIVRINDRGPFVAGRVIDLSRAAAEVLGFRDDGLANVELTVVQPPRTRSAGEALMQAVGRATRAVWTPPDGDGEAHVAEAEADSPAVPGVPAEDAAPAASPASSPATWNTATRFNGFFIQVGAFRDKLNADELVRRIQELGMSTRTRQAGNMVQVLVGPFHSPDEAGSAKRDLEDAGIDGFVKTTER